MSFLIPTNAVQIARFANGLYGAQLGFASTNGIVSDVSSGGLLGTFNNYYSLTFGAQTTASVASQIIANLGIVAGSNGQTASSVSVALAYVTGQLNAAAPAARGAAVKAVLDLWSSISADPVNGATYGAAATTWNNQISRAVQYAGAVNPDITIAQAAALPAAPNNLTLTTGTDNVTGSPSAANNISGLFNGSTATFGAGDSITPSGTTNSITLSDLGTSTGTFNPTTIAALSVNNVQSATITSAGTLTVNTASTAAGNQGWGGLTSLIVSDSGGGGNTSVTAARTTSTTLIESSAGTTTTTVNGGLNDNITVSGITGTGGALTVGSSTAANQPAGTVTLTANVSAATAAVTVGAVSITGGTVVSSTQSITAPTVTLSAGTTTLNGGANTSQANTATAGLANTAGTTSVTGTSATTSVTVKNPVPQASTFVVNWTPILASTTQQTEQVTIGGVTYTITSSTFTTTASNASIGGTRVSTTSYAAYTAAQVAQVAAGGTVSGLALTTSATPTYMIGAATSAGTNTFTAITSAGAQPGSVTGALATGSSSQTIPTISSAVGGIYAAPITITDVNGTSTSAAGTITSVTLDGLGNNGSTGNTAAGAATIIDNALTTLTINNAVLAPSTVTLTNSQTGTTNTVLTLNLNNTPGTVTLADTNNELTSLTINISGGGTAAAVTTAPGTNSQTMPQTVNGLTIGSSTTFTKVTTVTVNATAASILNLGSIASLTGLTTLSITGSAGLIATTTTANAALATINDSSSGSVFMTLAPTIQSFNGTGTGNTYLTVGVVATRPQTAGNSAVKNAIIWSPASGTTSVPTTLVGTGGSYTGFNDFATGSTAAAGTYNIATLQPTGSTFTALNIQGTANISFTNVAPGTSLTIDSAGTMGSSGYSTTGTTGATNTLALSLGNSLTAIRVAGGLLQPTQTGFTTTALTLSDSAATQTVANGVGTLTITSNAALAGQVNTITTLTDSSLSTLNISGSAGVTIPTLASVLASTLTINNTSSSSGTSTIGGTGFTDDNLNTITFTGTGRTTLSLADTSRSSSILTINQNSTGTTTIAALAGSSALSTLTVNGTGALTITTLSATNSSLILTANDSNASGLVVTNLIPTTVNTATSLNSLTLGGSGILSIGNFTNTGITAMSITNTNTSTVNFGSIAAINLPAALTPTYINGSTTGSFNIYEADTHGGNPTINLINNVNYFLSEGRTGAASGVNVTITGPSDNGNSGIYLAAFNPTTSATASSSPSATINFASGGTTGIAVGMLVTSTTALLMPVNNYVTAVTDTSVTLAQSTVVAIGASNTTMTFGGLNAAQSSITLGNGNNNIVIVPAAGAATSQTVILGSGNNVVRAVGANTGGNSVTATSGNNTIVFGVDTGATADAISLGAGNNTVTLGLNHTNRTNITFTTTNAANPNSLTTVTNMGGITIAIGAANQNAGTTLAMANVTGLVVGESITGTSIPAGDTITAINGNTITLAAATTALINAGTNILFGQGSTGANNQDIFTFANAALNTNIVNLGAVSSVSAGISGISSTQGYSYFTTNGNTYVYENTGIASTSELVALVGTGHNFTGTSTTVLTVIG